MQININVKGVSNKASKIVKYQWTYPDRTYTLRDFLCCTVGLCVEKYLEKPEDDALMSVLSAKMLEEGAAGGKIAFGRIFNAKKPDINKARETAIQAFEDGLIAFFLGETRMEDLDAALPLADGSEVTFIKLTFLAGRMW